MSFTNPSSSPINPSSIPINPCSSPIFTLETPTDQVPIISHFTFKIAKEEILHLTFSELYSAISLYEETREKYGGERKKIILFDMPLERQYACDAPDYRKLCHPCSAYLEYFNESNGNVKYIFLDDRSNNLYSVYKTPESIHVNSLESFDEFISRHKEETTITEKTDFSDLVQVSRELVTVYF